MNNEERHVENIDKDDDQQTNDRKNKFHTSSEESADIVEFTTIKTEINHQEDTSQNNLCKSKDILEQNKKVGSIEDQIETINNQNLQTETLNGSNPQQEVANEKLDNKNNNVGDQAKIENEYDPKNVHYEGDIAIYTDQLTGYQYQWSKIEEKWIPRESIVYGFEDDTHTYTDADGVKFFWDKEKNAWFPKINEDFMALYQMSYGFVDNISTKDPSSENKINVEVKPEPTGVKRKASEPSWFEVDEERNTKVYVSNLPTNISEDEFIELMQKYGLIMRDPITQKMKIKLYKEPDTDFLKGDALCTYIRVESVDLAIKLLDNYMFKGKKIKVERAKFQMRGEYDPKLKPKAKKRKEKDKLKKMQEKLFDWRPEKMIGERAKHERIVIVKNVFDPKVFDEEVGLILEYQQDLREECSKCGDVRKVIIFDRHPEGVIQVNMKEPEQADAAVALLNGRWFGKRQLTAEIWNGKTKYKIAETDSEISQRLNKWDKFLNNDDKVEGIKQ